MQAGQATGSGPDQEAALAPHLAGGVALLAVTFCILAAVALMDLTAGTALGAAMLMELVTGREATIPIALAGGAPAWAVALVSITQNLGLAALLSPLFARLLSRWQGQGHFFARRLRRLHAAAHARRSWVHRWGPVGLFVFMLAPLLANGAVLAVFLGRVAGLFGWRLWAAVGSGVVVTATAWTVAHDALLRLAASLDPRLPFALAGVMVALALAAAVVDEVKERRSRRSP